MQSQITTAPRDFESLRDTLLRKHKVLCLKNKALTREKEELQKRMTDLMRLEAQDTISVPEIKDIDFHVQHTTPEDCESFSQANQVLIQKNDNISEEIKALQKQINDLISQKTQVTSSVSSETTATEFIQRYRQNRKFWMEREAMEQNKGQLEKSEKLNLPKMEEKETQTSSEFKDMENAYKLRLQEKEAWEANKKQLMQQITVLTKQRSEIKAKEQQAVKDKEALQEQMEAIIKEAKMNQVAWEEEKENLQKEIVTLKEQKCDSETKANEAMQVNETLQREVLELQTLLQKEKQQSDIDEIRVRAHTWEKRLRTELEVAEAVHSFDELLQEQLQEKVRVLEEKPASLETISLGEPSLPSEPDTLPLWHRFVRFFFPGWRRQYSSEETFEYVDPWEQAREETPPRPTLPQRFVPLEV
ncbi:golgin subfamily A member 6-like protein 7 [Trachinotus anak]|uniref:golgin subfamily A member 6-like protein 7 n=1 Tax=Trachinotus anak TaxID=443729 RepID=UPI0039F1F622